jgi:hemolysin activation/secretion protein
MRAKRLKTLASNYFKLLFKLFITASVFFCFSYTNYCLAADPNLPSYVDPSRIKPERPERAEELYKKIQPQDVIPSYKPDVPVPKDAEKMKLFLKSIQIEGMSSFKEKDVKHTYKEYLKKEISLTDVYDIAKRITEIYRTNGYFLSIAYLPEQRIKNGIVIIKVIEGYIGKVEMPKEIIKYKLITNYVNQILKEKPLKIKKLENFLLTLKNLPTYSVSGTLSPSTDPIESKKGAVNLTITATKKPAKGELSIDNFSSRFAGPEQVSLFHSQSLLPLQNTTIAASNTVKLKNMNYFMASHSIAVTPDVSWKIDGNLSKNSPEFTLKSMDIKSKSKGLSIAIDYQIIRQRQENLSFRLSMNGRDSNSTSHDLPLTKDKIRTIKFSSTYDMLDQNNNYYRFNATFTKGIDCLNSSKPNQANISRSLAKPNFSKLELSFVNLHKLTAKWLLQINLAGQYAMNPLYSSEEFGYGGQSYGRAFDSSDITGDHGVAGLLELTYNGFKDWKLMTFPHVFYDIGAVWRRDPTRGNKDNVGSSGGVGCHFSTKEGFNGQVGFAWPLKRKISTPIYGGSNKGPRIILKLAFAY